MNASDLDDLAERMVPVAQRFVGAVHDDGLPVVARILDTLDSQERVALCVVLAAMVDPDRTAKQLLAWTEVLPQLSDPTLFEANSTESENPRDWTDEKCHRLWKEYRRKRGPVTTPEQQAHEAVMLRGHREWDRRKKLRARGVTPT